MTCLSDSEFSQLEQRLITIGLEQLPASEVTRWCLLLEALDTIAYACEERGVEFDYDNLAKKSKPHKAVLTYINERYRAFLHGMFLCY